MIHEWDGNKCHPICFQTHDRFVKIIAIGVISPTVERLVLPFPTI